jgi:Zn-dependent protease
VDIANLIEKIAIYALPVLFAITVHEAAHGYAARHFGDNTAWALGRITLNPVKHIDPIGTILMPLLLYFATAGTFLFGYAKPVPVRFGNLRNPKRDMIWVALAGPGANLVMALAWGAGALLLASLDVTEPFLVEMFSGGILVNVAMFAFNMFPVPPLDGGRVAVGLLPNKQAYAFSRIEPYTMYIFLGMALLSSFNVINLFSVFYKIWMHPVMSVAFDALDLVLTPLMW